jgi:predicted transcriptional regulator
MKTPEDYLKDYLFLKDSEMIKDLIRKVQAETIEETVKVHTNLKNTCNHIKRQYISELNKDLCLECGFTIESI